MNRRQAAVQAADERARQRAAEWEQDAKDKKLALDIRDIFAARLDYDMHDTGLMLACFEVVKMLRDLGAEVEV